MKLLAIEVTETFYPKDRASWRAWLTRNHARRKEIWLIRYKKHTGKPTIAYHDAVDEALCFGWIDSSMRRLDEDRYAQRFTPRQQSSGWSTANIERYKMLLKQGLVTEAGKEAFAKKSRVYTPHMLAGGRAWHAKNPMPRPATLEQRVAWHREHQKYCACRLVPKSILPYLK